MVKWVLVVAMLAAGGTADAKDQLPPLVNVTSVSASSSTTDADKLWQVVLRLGNSDGWCVDTSKGGIGESLTLTFDPPASVDGVAIIAYNMATPVTALDVIADGKTQRATKNGITIEAPLKGAPIAKLVLKMAAFDKGRAPAACISTLSFKGSPEPAIVYQVAAKEAAALEPRVRAIRSALQSCGKLGDALAFPFTHVWETMSREGMKQNRETYADAAKATAACKRGKLAKIAKAMQFKSVIVSSEGAGKVIVMDGEPWHLQLRDGTWVLATVGDN